MAAKARPGIACGYIHIPSRQFISQIAATRLDLRKYRPSRHGPPRAGATAWRQAHSHMRMAARSCLPVKTMKETVMKKYAESKGFFDFKAERELYSIVKAW